MSKDKNDNEIDLSRYKDSGGLSLNKLSFGLWFSEKRKLLNKIVIFFLVIISISLFSYSIYNYIFYFLNSSDDNNQSLVVVSSPKNQVADLIVSSPQTFLNNGSYDFSAFLENPNERFKATFKYCFKIDGVQFLCDNSFIFPSERKILTAFNKEINNLQSNVSLEIENVAWQRIDNREIPNWQQYLNERLNFSLRNINLNTNNDLNNLSFEITNNSAYSYYEVPLNISFYRQGDLAGVHRHIVTDFAAGETRSIRLSWIADLYGVNKTEIIPELNILDENVYKKYQGSF